MASKTFLSLGEQIYQTLKERIVENKYVPGTMLQIDKLAEELGVSSTPIRETLFKLDGIGLVTMIRNKGAIVSEISERMIKDVWQFRALLESFVAKDAVLQLDQTVLISLREKVEFLLKNPSDFELYKTTDATLHDMLCANSNNVLVKEALENLFDHSRRIRYFAENTPFREDVVHQVSTEHLAIIDALLNKDAFAVEEAMRIHLFKAEERTLKALAKE